MIKAGRLSTEFWALVGLAAMVFVGWLKPEAATTALSTGADPMELVLGTITDLAKGKGDIAIYAALAWAYIKRRSALKSKALGPLPIKGTIRKED
jgi:hypothetical protein